MLRISSLLAVFVLLTASVVSAQQGLPRDLVFDPNALKRPQHNEGTGSVGQRNQELIAGEKVRAPSAWEQFCKEYKDACNAKSSQGRLVVLDAKARRDLRFVNELANRNIKPMTDLEHWGTRDKRYVYGGVVDKWDYAEPARNGTRYGDCEEYVLVKQSTLINMGWPRSAVLITIVKRFNEEKKVWEGHAVLMVRTTEGDLILDNFFEEVKPWWQTKLQFVKRQSEEDSNAWVSLQTPTVASVK